MRWQHPWLRIELAIRAVLADRLARGASAKVDQVLMARVKERERIERAGCRDRGRRQRQNVRHTAPPPAILPSRLVHRLSFQRREP